MAFNYYFLTLIDILNIQQTNINSAILFLNNWFPNGFLKMINIPITEDEICRINSLKFKNSTGYDGISNKILKLCTHLSKPLAYVCNK
jgi:hypothetical protein